MKEINPMSVKNCCWIYHGSIIGDTDEIVDTDKCLSICESGKWLLFYDKNELNNKWKIFKELFDKKLLDGVMSMKCSTAYKNSRSSNDIDGVLILYCHGNEEQVMKISQNLVQYIIDDYKGNYIYYKTDDQTFKGTIATGSKKNHTYKVDLMKYRILKYIVEKQ